MAQEKLIELMKLSGTSSLTNQNYATVAKFFIESYMQDSASKKLTTSKLRNIYALVMNVYTKVTGPEDYERCKGDIQYIKVRMAYEAGRDESVKSFLKVTRLMDALDHVKSFEHFMLYCRYAESLVAYFKFCGGKDN